MSPWGGHRGGVPPGGPVSPVPRPGDTSERTPIHAGPGRTLGKRRPDWPPRPSPRLRLSLAPGPTWSSAQRLSLLPCPHRPLAPRVLSPGDPLLCGKGHPSLLPPRLSRGAPEPRVPPGVLSLSAASSGLFSTARPRSRRPLLSRRPRPRPRPRPLPPGASPSAPLRRAPSPQPPAASPPRPRASAGPRCPYPRVRAAAPPAGTALPYCRGAVHCARSVNRRTPPGEIKPRASAPPSLWLRPRLWVRTLGPRSPRPPRAAPRGLAAHPARPDRGPGVGPPRRRGAGRGPRGGACLLGGGCGGGGGPSPGRWRSPSCCDLGTTRSPAGLARGLAVLGGGRGPPARLPWRRRRGGAVGETWGRCHCPLLSPQRCPPAVSTLPCTVCAPFPSPSGRPHLGCLGLSTDLQDGAGAVTLDPDQREGGRGAPCPHQPEGISVWHLLSQMLPPFVRAGTPCPDWGGPKLFWAPDLGMHLCGSSGPACVPWCQPAGRGGGRWRCPCLRRGEGNTDRS